MAGYEEMLAEAVLSTRPAIASANEYGGSETMAKLT